MITSLSLSRSLFLSLSTSVNYLFFFYLNQSSSSFLFIPSLLFFFSLFFALYLQRNSWFLRHFLLQMEGDGCLTFCPCLLLSGSSIPRFSLSNSVSTISFTYFFLCPSLNTHHLTAFDTSHFPLTCLRLFPPSLYPPLSLSLSASLTLPSSISLSP